MINGPKSEKNDTDREYCEHRDDLSATLKQPKSGPGVLGKSELQEPGDDLDNGVVKCRPRPRLGELIDQDNRRPDGDGRDPKGLQRRCAHSTHKVV